jgi:hypothetical protein
MSWHVDAVTADRYVRAETDRPTSASIEAHVVACSACQAIVGAAVDGGLLASVMKAIDDALDQPQLRSIERGLRRIGVSDTASRIVAATTRAHWAFLFVVAASVGLALLSASSSGNRGDLAFSVFLVVAPLGPLLATAAAFGRWVDPTYAITKSTPLPVLRIVLIRTVSGVVPAIVLTALATPLLIDRGWLAVGWLIPSLALASAVLALSSWLEVELATLLIVLVWIAVLLCMRLSDTEVVALFSGSLQLISLAVAAAASALTIVRRTHFDYGGS